MDTGSSGARALTRHESGPRPPLLPRDSKHAAAMHSDADREAHSREPDDQPRPKETHTKLHTNAHTTSGPSAGNASQAKVQIELDARDRRRLGRLAEGLCLRAQACRHRVSWPALWRMLTGAVHCRALQSETPAPMQGLMARLRGAVLACHQASDNVVRGPARSILRRSDTEARREEAEPLDGSPPLTGLHSTGGSNDPLHRLPVPSRPAMGDLEGMGLGAETIGVGGVTCKSGALHGGAAAPSQREEEVLQALRADPLLRRAGLQLQQAVIGDWATQDSAAGGKGAGPRNREYPGHNSMQDRGGAGPAAAPGELRRYPGTDTDRSPVRDSDFGALHRRAGRPRTSRADDRESKFADMHVPQSNARRLAAPGSSMSPASLRAGGARAVHETGGAFAGPAHETGGGLASGDNRGIGTGARDHAAMVGRREGASHGGASPAGAGAGAGGMAGVRARVVPSKSSLAEHARAMREQEEKKRARALGRPGTFAGLGLAGLETAAGRRAALDSGPG